MEYLWILEPDSEYEIVNNKHDKGYKYILSTKRIFIQLLKSFVKESWVGDIDEGSIENIDKSFILNDFKGKNNWTAPINFKEILMGSELFDDYILDFKYLLFDVARYREEDLLKLGNLIGAVFYIEQERGYGEVFQRLRDLLGQLKELTKEDYNIFRTWLKNIVVADLERESAEEIVKLIDSTEEVENMVSNLTLAISKKLKESKLEGKLEGKLDVAKRMYIEGIELDKISSVTQIPIEELQEHISR